MLSIFKIYFLLHVYNIIHSKEYRWFNNEYCSWFALMSCQMLVHYIFFISFQSSIKVSENTKFWCSQTRKQNRFLENQLNTIIFQSSGNLLLNEWFKKLLAPSTSNIKIWLMDYGVFQTFYQSFFTIHLINMYISSQCILF